MRNLQSIASISTLHKKFAVHTLIKRDSRQIAICVSLVCPFQVFFATSELEIGIGSVET